MANNLSFSIEFDKEQKIYIIKAKTFLIQDGFLPNLSSREMADGKYSLCCRSLQAYIDLCIFLTKKWGQLYIMIDWDNDGEYTGFDAYMDMWLFDEMDADERRRKMVQAIRNHGYTYVDNTIFSQLCQEINIPINQFTQEDIHKISQSLNR